MKIKVFNKLLFKFTKILVSVIKNLFSRLKILPNIINKEVSKENSKEISNNKIMKLIKRGNKIVKNFIKKHKDKVKYKQRFENVDESNNVYKEHVDLDEKTTDFCKKAEDKKNEKEEKLEVKNTSDIKKKEQNFDYKNGINGYDKKNSKEKSTIDENDMRKFKKDVDGLKTKLNKINDILLDFDDFLNRQNNYNNHEIENVFS